MKQEKYYGTVDTNMICWGVGKTSHSSIKDAKKWCKEYFGSEWKHDEKDFTTHEIHPETYKKVKAKTSTEYKLLIDIDNDILIDQDTRDELEFEKFLFKIYNKEDTLNGFSEIQSISKMMRAIYFKLMFVQGEISNLKK